MTDAHDPSEGVDPSGAESAKRAAEECQAAERQFADKLAKRSPPNPVERAEIERRESGPKPAPHALLCTLRIVGQQEA
jgi:hypothetical protein